MKPVSGTGGSPPRRVASAALEVRHRLLRGRGFEKLRVVLFLEEHGHEPIFEPQFARAEDASAEGVVLELALAREHGVAHAFARARAPGKTRRRTGCAVSTSTLWLMATTEATPTLSSSEATLSDAFSACAVWQASRKTSGMRWSRSSGPSSLVKTVTCRRCSSLPVSSGSSKHSPPRPTCLVIDAVAIEVDDVIGLLLAAGAVEFLAQGGQRGRAEDVDLDQAGQGFHRLDQRQGAGAVVNVAARLVLRPRGDEQDADGRGDDGDVERLRARQASADAGGFRALEEIAVAVVEQFPRQAEQERGGFLGGLHVGLGRAGFERRHPRGRRSGGPRGRRSSPMPS